MTPGEFIRDFRKGKGISGPQMAKLLGVDYWRLQKWESGKGSPRYTDASAINRYFKREINQHLSPNDLSESLEAKYEPTEGIVTIVAEPTTLEYQLQEKIRRIGELEEMVANLKMALDAMKSVVGKQK